MCRRSSDQYAGVESSRSGQLKARMMSGRSAIRAVTACESRSPRRWMTRLERQLRRGVRAGQQDQPDALLVAALDHSAERGDDLRDGRPRPDHVIAAAVEGQVRRLQRESRFELLVDDRPGELAADGEVGVLDRLALRVSPALGDEVGPAAHATVGKLVADALGERVADGDEANGCHSPSLRPLSGRREHGRGGRPGPTLLRRRPRRTPRRRRTGAGRRPMRAGAAR